MEALKLENDPLKESNETSVAASTNANGNPKPWYVPHMHPSHELKDNLEVSYLQTAKLILRLSRRFSKSAQSVHIPPEMDTGNGHEIAASLSSQHLELWLVDLVSGQKMELAPSHQWLKAKLTKTRYDEVSHKMAKLKHPWRTAISDFLRARNESEPAE